MYLRTLLCYIYYINIEATPIIIGQLGGIITGLTDTLMVGWHSTHELAASSFVNNMTNTLTIMGTGFSFGLSRYRSLLRSSIVANLVTALLIVTVLMGLYLSIDRMGQPEELVPIIKLYGAGISTLVSRIVMLFIFAGVFVFKDKYAIY